MIYNARMSKMPVLEVAPVWASLKRIDGTGEYTWLLNPNPITYSINNNISALTPLGCTLPNIVPQNSSYQISLPLILVTPGNNRDLTDDIKILTEFSTMKGDKMPKLSFEFGDFKIPLCCIASFSLTIIQWRSGKPTAATGSLGLLRYEEARAPTLFKEDVVKKPSIALTDREQARVAEVMRGYEKTHNNVRVNGDYIEGVSRKTNKLVRIVPIKDIVKIDLNPVKPIVETNSPPVPNNP